MRDVKSESEGPAHQPDILLSKQDKILTLTLNYLSFEATILFVSPQACMCAVERGKYGKCVTSWCRVSVHHKERGGVAVNLQVLGMVPPPPCNFT